MSWLWQLTSLTTLNISANPELTLLASLPPMPALPLEAHQQLQPLQLPQQLQQPPQTQLQDLDLAPWDAWAVEPAPGGGNGVDSQSASIAAVALSGEAPPQIDALPDAITSACSCGMKGVGEEGFWPQLRRLNLLGTRVSEAGLRALLLRSGAPVATSSTKVSSAGQGGDSGADGSKAAIQSTLKGDGGCRGSGGVRGNVGLKQRLEQLKLGGPGVTDGLVVALAEAGLPSLHSLLIRVRVSKVLVIIVCLRVCMCVCVDCCISHWPDTGRGTYPCT